MSRDVKLLLASQPTRGLDVGSIEFVHKRLVAQRDAGAAVLIVSSELDEIYALADRIAVMYEGRIVAFCPPTIPEQELGLLMAGSAGDGSNGSGPGSGPDGSGDGPDGSGAGPERPVQEPGSHD
jgi:simple sugar transport system ATP-binding protein